MWDKTLGQFNQKQGIKLLDQLKKESKTTDAAEELTNLMDKVETVQERLGITDEVAQGVKKQLERSYEEALNAIMSVAGSEDQIAQMWGYNVGEILYEYLNRRDTAEGRQALSFLKMNLGYHLSLYGYCGEIHFANFIMGLALRFMVGFEKLRANIAEIQEELNRFESKTHTESDSRPKLFQK